MLKNVNINELKKIINKFFLERNNIINYNKDKCLSETIKKTLFLLDNGIIQIVEKKENGDWYVNQWIKKAIILSFLLNEKKIIKGAPQNTYWWDKIDLKFLNWKSEDFIKSSIRVVPNAIVRYSAYIADETIIMPSFINVGAYIDKGTMIDTWSTIGSCARIGRNVHISGGVGIGGVLEPLQDNPTIIEDNCFIGARSEVVEGCIVRKGSVLGMGVFIGKSTKIIDRNTGKIMYGEIPPYSVVIPGSIQGSCIANKGITPNIYCAVIVKKVDEQTRKKTSINELLRA